MLRETWCLVCSHSRCVAQLGFEPSFSDAYISSMLGHRSDRKQMLSGDDVMISDPLLQQAASERGVGWRQGGAGQERACDRRACEVTPCPYLQAHCRIESYLM